MVRYREPQDVAGLDLKAVSNELPPNELHACGAAALTVYLPYSRTNNLYIVAPFFRNVDMFGGVS